MQERSNSIANALELHISCTNHIDGLVQERSNSIANALELCLSCTNHIDGLVQERSNSIANALELCLSCTNHINGLVQERSNSIANALELCLSCTNPLIYIHIKYWYKKYWARIRCIKAWTMCMICGMYCNVSCPVLLSAVKLLW